MEYVLVITIHADPAMAPGYEEWGGTHVYMKELIDGFAARKIKCVMFTRKGMNFLDIEEYSDYCTVIRLSNGEAKPIDKTLLWKYHEYNLAQIQAFIDTHGKPRVIHSVYWNSGRIAMELGRENDIPFVHSVISNSRGRTSRGATEAAPFRSEYEQQIFTSAKVVICVSDEERDDIVNLYNVPSDKVVVAGQHIHEAFLLPSRDVNGFPRLSSALNSEDRSSMSINFNSAYTIETDEQYWNHKVFTYIGRVGFNKGLEQIVKSWHCLYERFGQACPPLWIAGGSIAEIHHIRETLRQDIPLIDRIEGNRYIVWWGYLDAAGLSTLLMKTLALIMHSYYEPGGRVIVEAMAEGVPVIATPYGFGKDYVSDWQNGFLVEHGDIEGLCSRMAHFLHQPYLSDALGQNARQDAKSIIKSWNFFDNHLMAYGIRHTQDTTTEAKSANYDYFKARRVNLFPHLNLPLSENYIKDFVIRLTGCDVNDFQQDIHAVASSDIFKANTAKGAVIIKQVFTRLRLSPMLNPFDKGCYVKKATKAFGVELNAYKRLGSNTLLGFDETHYLLALKELDPIEQIDYMQLKCCIDYIASKNDTATQCEKSLYCQITQGSDLVQDSIMKIYAQLEQHLPDYYFERSGRFCDKIGWASAPYILDFNRDIFSQDVFQELKKISVFFFHCAQWETDENLRSINLDVRFRHFMLNGKSIELIDLEKYSIGCVEVEIASLFYDYINTTDNDISTMNIQEILPKTIDIRKVISYMAHICFYEIQVNTVIERKLPENELALFRQLFQISHSMHYT